MHSFLSKIKEVAVPLHKIGVHLKEVNTILIEAFDVFRMKNTRLRSILAILFFLFCLNWFYSYVGVYSFLDSRPTSIHSSAQCQRASIALNYYENDMNFFLPQVQRYSLMGGVTGVEFPIIYYMDALAYKVFGFNEVYGRIISLLIVSLGIFAFFLISQKVLKSTIMAILVVGSASFSPVLLFYSPNFMPDAPSMAMVLASWYFFFKYLDTPKTKYITLFLLLSTLAALIKVVALISPIALVCIAVLDKMGYYKKQRSTPIFPKLFPLLLKTALSILIVFSWYFYANWLAKAYQNETFSLSPVLGDSGTWDALVQNVKVLWLFHYYAYETYVLMGAAIILLVVLYNYVSRLLFSITFLFLLGNLAFVYFFLNQFINHDYYVISILPVIFFLFLTMTDAVLRFSRNKFVLLIPVFFVILFFNMKEAVLNCKENYEFRYSNKIYYWTKDERPYFDLERRLRSAGIKRTDLTISGFEDTFCSSLYLMNQIGIPISSWDDSLRIKELVTYKESKYLVLNDSSRFNKLYPNDFAKDIVLSHRGLIVYRLNH